MKYSISHLQDDIDKKFLSFFKFASITPACNGIGNFAEFTIVSENKEELDQLKFVSTNIFTKNLAWHQHFISIEVGFYLRSTNPKTHKPFTYYNLTISLHAISRLENEGLLFSVKEDLSTICEYINANFSTAYPTH